jgi:hypothetical protein
MNQSIFHTTLFKFIEKEYPATQSHPIEDPLLLKSWGLKPKIYRPLPRTLFHKELGIEEIKTPYRDIEELKKHLIDTSVLSLYSHSPRKVSIVLFTWVYWDGWGDFHAQLDCAELIETCFPDAKLMLVTCHRSNQKPPETRPYQYFIPFEKGNQPQFPEFLLKKMRKAHLLFQFPTYCPYTDKLIKTLGPQLEYECLGESGFLDTPDYILGCKRRCMGLHFLEKGLFLKSLPPKKAASPYYFAYTRTTEGLSHYIQALIAWKKTDLIVYVFKIQHVINLVKRGIPYVKTVEIMVDHTLTSVPLNKKGIILRFHVMQNIPHDQFLSLLHESEDFVACTGDGSFFEAISAGKLFYYDTPKHKMHFQKDLVALASARTPDALPFFDNPIAIQDSSVRKALRKLTRIIYAEHSVNDTLCHIIHRALCHQAYPKLKQIENHILNAFAKGEIDAPIALKAIKKNINMLTRKE